MINIIKVIIKKKFFICNHFKIFYTFENTSISRIEIKFKSWCCFLNSGDIIKVCEFEGLNVSLLSFAHKDSFASSLFILCSNRFEKCHWALEKCHPHTALEIWIDVDLNTNFFLPDFVGENGHIKKKWSKYHHATKSGCHVAQLCGNTAL